MLQVCRCVVRDWDQCLISVDFFLFWTPKQKAFLGPPAKAKESTPLWAKDGVAGGVGDRL